MNPHNYYNLRHRGNVVMTNTTPLITKQPPKRSESLPVVQRKPPPPSHPPPPSVLWAVRRQRQGVLHVTPPTNMNNNPNGSGLTISRDANGLTTDQQLACRMLFHLLSVCVRRKMRTTLRQWRTCSDDDGGGDAQQLPLPSTSLLNLPSIRYRRKSIHISAPPPDLDPSADEEVMDEEESDGGGVEADDEDNGSNQASPPPHDNGDTTLTPPSSPPPNALPVLSVEPPKGGHKVQSSQTPLSALRVSRRSRRRHSVLPSEVALDGIVKKSRSKRSSSTERRRSKLRRSHSVGVVSAEVAIDFRRRIVKHKWKRAIKQVIAFQRMAADKTKSEETVIEVDDSLPERFVDYFLVYAPTARVSEKLLHEQRSASKLSRAAQQARLLEVNRSVDFCMSQCDRYPRKDHHDFPVDANWSAFAWPGGQFVWRLSQCFKPYFYFVVMTIANGTQLYATWLCVPTAVTRSLRAGSMHSASTDELPRTSEWYTCRCLCLVSHYPYFEAMRKCLGELYNIGMRDGGVCSNGVCYERYISMLCAEIPLPVPGRFCVQFRIGDTDVELSSSVSRGRADPRISMSHLFDCLSVDHILNVLSSIYTEHRIIFTSSSYSRLMYVTQSFVELVYPFQWWYSFIPCVMESMVGAHQMPQPYILGIHSKFMSQVNDMSNVVLVDIDNNDVRFDGVLPRLPLEQGRTLYGEFKWWISYRAQHQDVLRVDDDEAGDTDDTFNCGIREAMLRFHCELVSGYRKFLFFIQDVPFFNGTGFRDHQINRHPQDTACGSFYESFISSRAFDVFLEDENLPYGTNERRIMSSGGSTITDIHEYVVADSRKLPPFVVPTLHKNTKKAKNTRSVLRRNVPRRPFHVPMQERHFIDGLPLRTFRLLRSPSTASSSNSRSISKRAKHLESESERENRQQHSMKVMLSRVFASGSLGDSDLQELDDYMSSQSVRTEISTILEQSQHDRGALLCLAPQSFRSLHSILWSLLDRCVSVVPPDYATPSAVITACSKYYMQNTNGERVYIEKKLYNHPLWKRTEYWLHSLHVSLAAKSRGEIDEREFVFQWLISGVHNMLNFGMGYHEALAFVNGVCESYHITTDDRITIHTLCENISQALTQW